MAMGSKVFSEGRKSEINSQFQSMSYAERKLWMSEVIEINSVKRRYTQSYEGQSRKAYSLSYSLPTEQRKNEKVCKRTFFATLGWKSDGVITSFVNARTGNPKILKLKDMSGQSTLPNKLNDAVMIDHINSFNPQISQYRHEHAPLRRYFECSLSIRAMWRDFYLKHHNVSYEAYRSVFDKQRITFGQPSEDECDTCIQYTQHVKETILENHSRL